MPNYIEEGNGEEKSRKSLEMRKNGSRQVLGKKRKKCFIHFPLIINPTRITAHSATHVDNIFVNNLAPQQFSGIILNDFSDHLPVFVHTFEVSFCT